MSKTAIAVFSDPKSGSEEALGRLFNAMLLTLGLKDKGQEVASIAAGRAGLTVERLRADGKLPRLSQAAIP